MKINSRLDNGIMLFDIIEYETEDDFGPICALLEKQYKLEVCSKLSAPGATIWDISIEGRAYALVNNSYGNFLRPQDIRAALFMEQELPVLNFL